MGRTGVRPLFVWRASFGTTNIDHVYGYALMPPQLLFELSGINLDGLLMNQEAVRECNPQRGEMEQLNGIIWADPAQGLILGFKDVKADEFWVKGHIPGRPLFPGVLMIEAAAQLASLYTRKYVGWKGFIGFGGVTEVKFRAQVPPGVRMLLLGQKIWERHKRIACRVQGIVGGNMVFEAEITGPEFSRLFGSIQSAAAT